MTVKDELYKSLDVSSRRGRGGTYSYVKWQDVADRMNEVFGINWSSQVTYQDIVGNNIIVRVSVCAKDPVSGELFCQEGYGGAPNDDRAEAGNPFKSAYSKALKDACKRWGIGLNLDEDAEPVASTSGMPSGFTGREFGVPEAPKMQEGPTPTPPPTDVPLPPAMSVPQTPGMSMPGGVAMEQPMMKVGSDGRVMEDTSVPAPEPTPVPPAPEKKLPSMPSPGGMSMPASVSMGGGNTMQTQATPSFAQPKVTPVTTPEEGSISDVQKVALNNILKQLKDGYGIEYEGLAAEAFADAGISKAVPSPEHLSYEEALKVIKYGNTKFRKGQ